MNEVTGIEVLCERSSPTEDCVLIAINQRTRAAHGSSANAKGTVPEASERLSEYSTFLSLREGTVDVAVAGGGRTARSGLPVTFAGENGKGESHCGVGGGGRSAGVRLAGKEYG
ncbi:hypothetical protein CRG98_035415 [Punica granatum]|uniref:Uncharacterized protein n=1 Tax=Punica granatum TaxID=22663 RepID=A0A2I0IJJ2_PUNGR|nr:hypothetical protein CRG98_035415 [Punica granatum]